MINIPAHKQTDPQRKPGQVVNDVTLGDYIHRKTRANAFDYVQNERKLKFEEWYLLVELQTHDKTEYDCMKMAWQAGQENK